MAGAHRARCTRRPIELGLDRVRARQAGARPRARLSRSSPSAAPTARARCARCSKRSSHRAGYRVGCYTSPHLLRYNERVRIGMREAARRRPRARVRGGRGGARRRSPLTYFEFGTLAAIWLFVEQGVEVAVLEVGLGGRLDAVNAFDADCAVVVSVDLDHMDYLGGDREAIGFEKAGIFRAGRPAICADRDPPRVAHASMPRTSARRCSLIGTRFRLRAPGRGSGATGGPRGKRSGAAAPGVARRDPARQCGGRDHRARYAARARCRSRRRCALRAAAGGAPGPLPGAAGPAGGDPRRRAQSARCARAGREPRAASSAAAAPSPCSRCSRTRTSRA